MGSSDTKAVHLENKGPDTQVPIVLDDQYENELLAVQLGNQDKEIKRILRKLDLRLVLTLSVLYLWAFIDRGNLANVSWMTLQYLQYNPLTALAVGQHCRDER